MRGGVLEIFVVSFRYVRCTYVVFWLCQNGNGVVRFVIPNFFASYKLNFCCKSFVVWRAVRIVAHGFRTAMLGCVSRVCFVAHWFGGWRSVICSAARSSLFVFNRTC